MTLQQVRITDHIEKQFVPVTTFQLTPRTLQSTLSVFFDLRDEWMRSECRVRMLELLAQHRLQHGWNIREAIVFGIGNFCSLRRNPDDHSVSRDSRIMKCQRDSLMQLAVFLDIADNLRDDSNGKMDIFAQEILFSNLEAAVLTQLDVSIVSDPEGQHRVGASVFTFAPFWGGDLELLCQFRHRQPTLHLGLTGKFLLGRASRCIGGDILMKGFKSLDFPLRVWASKLISHLNGMCHEERERRQLYAGSKRLELFQKYVCDHGEATFPGSNLSSIHSSQLYNLAFQFQKEVLASDGNKVGSCEVCADGSPLLLRDQLGLHRIVPVFEESLPPKLI